MKKYKYIFLLLCSSVLLFTACSEDKLEIPQKGVISLESFYITDADAESALVNAYKDFAQNIGGNSGIYVPHNILFNYCADNVLAAGEKYGDNDQFASVNEFRFDGSNEVVENAYKRLYYVIYNANLVIKNFEYGQSAVKDRCISEARVLRAWCHMMAAMAWGTPPLVDDILPGDAKPGNYTGTQKELLLWCAKECEEAAPYIPERTSYSDKDGAVKVTKGFAQTVQGKALLYAGEYAAAKVPLKAVIASGKYQLVSGERWRDLFHIQGDGCEEKVFESNLINTASIGDWSGKIQRSTWMESNLWGWRTSRLASRPKMQGDDGWGGLAIEETFAEEFYANDGDSYRRKATMITYDEFVTELKWTSDSIDRTTGWKLADKTRGIKDPEGLYGQCRFLQRKHIVAPEDRTTNWYRFNNFIIERYADVLLMYAEACAQTTDDDGSGVAALNEVQRRAVGGGEQLVTPLTLANVQKERNYELWMEGSRWIDMKRWNEWEKAKKAGTHIPSLKNALIANENGVAESQHRGYVTYSEPNAGKVIGFKPGKHELFPYPASVLRTNTSLKQNPGWE